MVPKVSHTDRSTRCCHLVTQKFADLQSGPAPSAQSFCKEQQFLLSLTSILGYYLISHHPDLLEQAALEQPGQRGDHLWNSSTYLPSVLLRSTASARPPLEETSKRLWAPRGGVPRCLLDKSKGLTSLLSPGLTVSSQSNLWPHRQVTHILSLAKLFLDLNDTWKPKTIHKYFHSLLPKRQSLPWKDSVLRVFIKSRFWWRNQWPLNQILIQMKRSLPYIFNYSVRSRTHTPLAMHKHTPLR